MAWSTLAPVFLILTTFSLLCEAQVVSRIDLGPYLSNILLSASNLSTCLGPLGCFKIEPPFYNIYNRQVTLLPFNRTRLDVKFHLYSNENHKNHQIIWAEKLDASNFNTKLKTKILVHGFTDRYQNDHWIKLREALLQRGRYNVIVVDWARANREPYDQAVSNARAVGAEIALLIQSLINNTGVNAQDFHLIGHSLGAHVSGYAGERIKNLGRITGLDPAGPFFAETPKEVSLDKTDANFVDIIHTNSGETILSGLGIAEEIGHVDFIANNGKSQPGCTRRNAFTNVCDHLRALHLFTESITNPDCSMVAIKCGSYYSFSRGRCGHCSEAKDKCLIAGIDSDVYWSHSNTNKVYYFKTGSVKNYCQFQYRITINTMVPETAAGWLTKGRATLLIVGRNASVQFKLGTGGYQLYAPDKTYTYLVSTHIDLRPIEGAVFKWDGDHYQKPGTTRTDEPTGEADIFLKYLKIKPILIEDEEEIKLCLDDGLKGRVATSVDAKFNRCTK